MDTQAGLCLYCSHLKNTGLLAMCPVIMIRCYVYCCDMKIKLFWENVDYSLEPQYETEFAVSDFNWKWPYLRQYMRFLFGFILYVPVNSFLVMFGWISLGWTSTKQGIKCLSLGHNLVTPVKLESAIPGSWVKLSTIEPPRSMRF